MATSDVKFKNETHVKKFAEGNLEFALNLYQTLLDKSGGQGNLFCSPFSITAALCMTYAGARSNTADQMTKTMKLDETGSSESVHLALGDVHQSLKLNEPSSDTVLPFVLHCANRMYVQESYNCLNSFLAILSDHYGTEATKVDFIKNTEPTRALINRWVEEVTRDKIKDLISQDTITAATRLVLVNAIYFKGTWMKRFNKSLTVDDDFYSNPDDKSIVKMMFVKARFAYAEDAKLGCKLLKLPYRDDGRLGMYIILPNAIDGLKTLESQFTPQVFTSLKNSTDNVEVKVKIPRFRLETAFDLKDTLSAMGISDLFDPANADLGGISGSRDLYVSAVIHKAFVDVNEEGTEAAAATGVALNLRCARIEITYEFYANHPFLFLIYDHHTNLILFVGRLRNPDA